MRALERLTERKDATGSPVSADSAEGRLADLVDAAVDQRPRLNPHAVDRIEARLTELEDAEGARPSRFWRGLRMPAYVMATALVAVVLWTKMRVGVETPLVATQAPNPGAPGVPHPLRLDTGSLEVHTDREPATIETPRARVEVAPNSTVRIRVGIGVEQYDVRIAATSGSAKIFYFDGRTELALPASGTPAIAPTNSAETMHAAVHKPKAHSVAPEAAPIVVAEPAAPVAPPAVHGDPERASLLAALAKLRSAPQDALGLLDAHLARFPDGLTRTDAERARIAVLIKLSHKPEALEALDHFSALTTELRVVRAELRVDAQRYEEAVGDFGAVLVADEDRFAQRALYGRAICRQKQGDRLRMTADLERYLLLYPRGEFADRVRTELRRATSEASR